MAITSTKSMTGHLLGGAGGIETVATVLALKNRIAPPTINIDQLDPEADADIVRGEPRELLYRGPDRGPERLVRLRRAQRCPGLPYDLRHAQHTP